MLRNLFPLNVGEQQFSFASARAPRAHCSRIFPSEKKSQNRLLCCRKKRVVTTRHAAGGNRKIEIAADHRSVTRVKHFSFSLRFSPRSETARKPFFSTVMHENCGAANCLPLNCFAHFSVDFVTGFFGSDSRQLRNPRRSS
jgi:hypothetical protein